MRLRNVKDAKERIDEAKKLIMDIPRNEKYPLDQVFNDGKPLEIEIGAGKGQFSHSLAKRQKATNHIAIEKFDSVIIRALEKLQEDPVDNLFLARCDAEQLSDFFGSNTVDKIYLNFSDPWPKARHEKRRLTHENFLKQYEEILKPEGVIEFKTDNRSLFEFSIQSLNHYGMVFEFISLDLHKDDIEDNIVTEFEERFSKHGPIYKLIARFKRGGN